MCWGGGSRHCWLQAPGGHQEGNAKPGVARDKLQITNLHLQVSQCLVCGLTRSGRETSHLSLSEF